MKYLWHHIKQRKDIQMIKKYKDNLYLIDKNTLRRFMKANVHLSALEKSNIDDFPIYEKSLDRYFEDEKKTDPNYSIDTFVDNWINKIDRMNNNNLVSIQTTKDLNNDCNKSDCNTNVNSTKADIYNAVQDILKELGFETFETNDIEAKGKIYEKLINQAKATRKLADNTELLPDLSDEDITNLKMTLNELISFTTARSHNLMHAKGIESWLKHELKL